MGIELPETIKALALGTCKAAVLSTLGLLG